jgi:hypothetical protein
MAATSPPQQEQPCRPVYHLPDAPPLPPTARPDVEAFLRNAAASPPLVRYVAGGGGGGSGSGSGGSGGGGALAEPEARDEAVDLCAAAVEKHAADAERCVQVSDDMS